MAIQIPQNWKENKEFVALVWGAGRGSTDNTKHLRETLNRGLQAKENGDNDTYKRIIDGLYQQAKNSNPVLLDRAMTQLKQVHGNLKNIARTVEDAVLNSAIGGESRITKEGPTAMRLLFKELRPFAELGFLTKQGQSEFKKAKNETEKQIKEFGGITGGAKVKELLNKISIPNVIAVDQGSLPKEIRNITTKIDKNIAKEVVNRRRLLDTEANIRRGRETGVSEQAVLRAAGIDESSTDVLDVLQRQIRGIEGLESARQASISQSTRNAEIDAEREKVMQDRLAAQQDETELRGVRGSRFPVFPEYDIQGFDDRGRVIGGFKEDLFTEERAMNIQENMLKFMRESGEGIDAARAWALKEKVPGTIEYEAVNAIADDLDAESKQNLNVSPQRYFEIKENMLKFMRETGEGISNATEWALREKGADSPEVQAVNAISNDLGKTFSLTAEKRDAITMLEEKDRNANQSIDALQKTIIDALPAETLEDIASRDISEDELRDIMRYVESKVGDTARLAKQRAIEDYQTTKRFARENLETILKRVDEDLSRGIRRLNRQTEETLRVTRSALAERGLTRGGARLREEGLIEEQRQNTQSDLERQAIRGIEDSARTFGRQFGQAVELPKGLRDLGVKPSVFGSEPGTITRQKDRFLVDLEKATKEQKEEEIARQKSLLREQKLFQRGAIRTSPSLQTPSF